MLLFLKIEFIDNMIIFLLIVLFFSSLYLSILNKKLQNKIDDLKKENKKKYEEDISYNDIMQLKDISDELHDEDKDIALKQLGDIGNSRKKNNSVEKNYVKEKDKEINEYKNINKGKDINVVENRNDSVVNEFNASDFIRGSRLENDRHNGDSMSIDYLDEISKKIESEIKPQTVVLTDYEREQEENAIISYRELVDSNNGSGDDVVSDDTEGFLNSLKKFRNSLDK